MTRFDLAREVLDEGLSQLRPYLARKIPAEGAKVAAKCIRQALNDLKRPRNDGDLRFSLKSETRTQNLEGEIHGSFHSDERLTAFVAAMEAVGFVVEIHK